MQHGFHPDILAPLSCLWLPSLAAIAIAKGTLLQYPASSRILREVEGLQKVTAKVIDGTRLIGYARVSSDDQNLASEHEWNSYQKPLITVPFMLGPLLRIIKFLYSSFGQELVIDV